jgi:hypothetical protein
MLERPIAALPRDVSGLFGVLGRFALALLATGAALRLAGLLRP